MKNRFTISFSVLATLVVLSALFLVSTSSAQGTLGAPPKVLAVETFLADIAQNVAGNRLKVAALLPLGADPHSFEPTPLDVRKVADCNVLIVNGAGMDVFLDKLLENAGGVHKVINASEGLVGRTMREGEVSEMDDSDISDAICRQAHTERTQKIQSGKDLATPIRIAAESGFFQVSLAKLANGSYGGYLTYSSDEQRDVQIATGKGLLKVLKAAGHSPMEIERKVSLDCGKLARGNIVELEKKGEYIIALTDFETKETPLLIGPLGGHHHHEGDPHFWLNPKNVEKYVRNIQHGLSEVDPAGTASYASQADAYINRLKELDTWIADQVSQIPPERRLLVTNHESFGYFADRYGFRIIGTIVPSVSPEAAPSAKQLARLIERIRATGVKSIFLETGTNPVLARQVAQETGTRVVAELYDHSITGPDGPAPTYIDMMKYDTKAIVNALK